MPIISGLKAPVAWARHPDEHMAVGTVREARCRVPGPRAGNRSGFRSVCFLSCKKHHSQSGAWPHARCLATHPSSQACAQRRHAHACTAPQLWLQGWYGRPLCSPPPEGPCGQAQSRPQPLLCAAAPWLPSSAPRGGQRGPYWPTPLQLQPSGPSGECARPGAQPSAHPWALALGRGLTDAHTGTGNSYLSKEWRNGDTGPLFLSTFGNWCRGGRRMGLGAESPHSPGRTQCCFQRDLLGRLLI